MECLFEKYGSTTKKVHFIPVRDERGVPQDKFLRVVEGGAIWYKLLEIGDNKLPQYIQEINGDESN